MTANSRLRTVLALGYGGLLALLVWSGASALQTLRRLHDAEETAHARSLERRRVLGTVVLSASIYADRVEEFMLSYNTLTLRTPTTRHPRGPMRRVRPSRRIPQTALRKNKRSASRSRHSCSKRRV